MLVTLDTPKENLMGRTVTIASQKGGVGKTTTVVNLASSLSLSGKKVLMIDLDPQGNATSGVGRSRSFSQGIGNPSSLGGQGFLKSILEGEGLASFVIKTPVENLSVIPASTDLSGIEIIKEIQDSAIPKFKRQVAELATHFDYILIDCPPSLGGLPTISLKVSDSVLIPIQCEYYAMEGLSQILPVVRDLQRTVNLKLDIFGLLLTMYSQDLELSHDVVGEVRGYFGDLTFETIIPRDVVLAEAASHGIPAFQYQVSSRGAWSYIQLAKEVLANERT